MLVFAHTGHVLTTIAYFVPVVGFLGWLIVTQIGNAGATPPRARVTMALLAREQRDNQDAPAAMLDPRSERA